MNEPIIYAIGNPSIDIIINAEDKDLDNLGKPILKEKVS